MTARRIVVVSAGLGQPSSTRLLADQLAAATELALADLGETAEIEIVELREHAHELTNHLLTGFPTGGLRTALEAVTRADALIAVTPIFSASYSGLFKLFFDVLEPAALVGTPVLVAATAGTARHSLALEHAMRPLFSYLRAVVVPTAVFAASEDWGSGGDAGPERALAERVDRAAGELAGLLAGRVPRREPDPFDEVTPFQTLLTGR